MPLWGQSGEFLVDVEGIRAVVRMEGRGFSWMHHFEFHAIDADTPFISETGYRSHFARPVGNARSMRLPRFIYARSSPRKDA